MVHIFIYTMITKYVYILVFQQIHDIAMKYIKKQYV